MTTVTLSSGIDLTFSSLPAAMAQDLILSLMTQQLIDESGNIIGAGDVDEMGASSQFTLLSTIMDIIQDVLSMPGVVDVKLPRSKDKSWLKLLLRRTYIRKTLSKEDLEGAFSDIDLQKFLYIRYVAVQSVEDLNVILNNTLLVTEEE